MTETLTTSGAVKLKAGANRPTDDTVLTAANYTQFINDGEAWYCVNGKYDFVTNYSSLSTIGKAFLNDATAAYAAVEVINYKQSNQSSKQEAQVMIDVNYTKVVEATNLIRDAKFVEFIKTGTTG